MSAAEPRRLRTILVKAAMLPARDPLAAAVVVDLRDAADLLAAAREAREPRRR